MKSKKINELVTYFKQIQERVAALKPAIWQWDLDLKKLAIHVPPQELTHLQRSEAQYSVPMTEEEIIFYCHAHNDIKNLININIAQANDIVTLKEKVKQLTKKGKVK